MPSTPNRVLWGTLVVLALIWIGLVAGTAVGAMLLPEGSGLAGPAIALGYGIASAVVAGLIGVLLTRRLPSGALRLVGLVAATISFILLALVAVRAISERAEHGIGSKLNGVQPELAVIRQEGVSTDGRS